MDEEEISDDSFRMSHRIRGAGEKKPTFSSSFSLKTPPKAKKQNSRALLQNSNNGNVAAYLEPCADPFWPYCSRDDANAVCDDDAWRESRSFHDEYRQTSFMAIFSGSSDLLTPASLHEMCKVEDVVMQLSGYSEHCARSPKPCSGTAPSADAGLANTYFATGDAATRTRCFPPVSINRVLMANLTVSSCDAWVTTTGLSDRLETIRGTWPLPFPNPTHLGFPTHHVDHFSGHKNRRARGVRGFVSPGRRRIAPRVVRQNRVRPRVGELRVRCCGAFANRDACGVPNDRRGGD